MEDQIKEAKAIIKSATSIAVLTGAGISAESGIPTFRGEEGIWKKFRSEELANWDAFKRDPKLVWEWYDWRRGIVNESKPNPGHYALVNLEIEKTDFTLVTQNIDGLHQVAGSKNIIEMHGNLWQIKCTSCGIIEQNHDVPIMEIPPRCKNCGTLSRPNVVWFGEIIPISIIDKILLAIERCQVMLITGTSGVVEPAASMGLVAKHTGKTVIEVNLESTINSSVYDLTILGKSGEILPMLCSPV
ncbi:MAG TPA: NAD-dependent deacylase [Thermodesulfobacteriota bacterium]